VRVVTVPYAINDFCRRMIRMLDAEKKELLTDLHLARSPLNNVKDNKMASEIVRLLNLTDKYDAEIQSEKLQVTCVHWSLNANNLSNISQYCKQHSPQFSQLYHAFLILSSLFIYLTNAQLDCSKEC
jgi:hypothetical protein